MNTIHSNKWTRINRVVKGTFRLSAGGKEREWKRRDQVWCLNGKEISGEELRKATIEDAMTRFANEGEPKRLDYSLARLVAVFKPTPRDLELYREMRLFERERDIGQVAK